MKMATKILSGICVLIACFILLPANISCQGYPASSGETITITYDFPEPRVEETWEVPPPKGDLPVTEGYVSVTMEGLPQWSEPGLPVLPFKTAKILLPCGFDVERITVTCGNKVALPSSYIVEPGQEAVPLSYEDPVKLTPPDPDVYDSSAPFPGKLYSGDMVQNKAGQGILLVNLHPVEYIPKRGQISYYESLTVKVTLRAAAAEGELQCASHLAQDEDMVREMVDNPNTIVSYPAALSSFKESPLLDSGDYKYVIITNAALNATPGPDNFQALRDEKISRNITSTIVTTEWIYATYNGTRPDGGADNQTRIRNFIIDAYENWGTKYVLLGGDGDGDDVGGESGDDIIPHRGFASVSGEIDYDIPADMYYACLDGTFDDDADGIYGEPNDGPGGGEVDLFAEVYVGRAPVDSEAEVHNFVSKTLAYQNISETDENLSKVWMVGEYLGFGGVANWGGNYKDEIKEGSSAHNYTTVGFEDSTYAPKFDVSTLYDRDYPGYDWPKGEIVDIINDNTHLINHLGHAYVDYVMKMYNPDVDGLTNDELYFIGYSQGCYCGAFDDRDDYGYYTDYDCISEHLTTEPHGAVAFIANSRYGWGVLGSTDGPSQHYDREFWDAVLGEDMLNIGIANQDSKEDNAGRIGNWLDRWCYYDINLFGDPELTLKLHEGVKHNSHEIDDSAGGDGDGYPEPGESITMPVTLRNTSTNTTFLDVTGTLTATTRVTTTIFSEEFEGSWPGNWTVEDQDTNSEEDYWGQSNYRACQGSFSAYCAEVSDVSGQYYDNDMEAFMVRDVDLSAYDSATLSYKYWLKCEYYYDHLNVGYFDGSWHWVQSYTGYIGSWVSDSIEVPSTATQVGFMFYSDYSIRREGAYIDDVVLTGYSYVYVTDPCISISDDSEDYGNISPGNVTTSLDAYDFTIDLSCPAGHVITFTLNITASNGGPWTANFEEMLPVQYDLTISSTAGGTVTTPGEDTFTYNEETVVDLVAVADAGYRFGNWTGNVGTIANVDDATTSITMYDDYSITANFVAVYDLTITSTEGGSVTPGVGTHTYDKGTVVDLVATPDADYQFAYWTGDVGTIANANATTTNITMYGDYSIRANFGILSDGVCFIATATYGTPMAAEVQILREFRDKYLLTNPVGKTFVDFYYAVSPPIAEFITEYPSLKPIVRAGLAPAVAISTIAVNTTLAEKMVIIGLLVLVSVALAIWAMRRRGRGQQYT